MAGMILLTAQMSMLSFASSIEAIVAISLSLDTIQTFGALFPSWTSHDILPKPYSHLTRSSNDVTHSMSTASDVNKQSPYPPVHPSCGPQLERPPTSSASHIMSNSSTPVLNS